MLEIKRRRDDGNVARRIGKRLTRPSYFSVADEPSYSSEAGGQ